MRRAPLALATLLAAAGCGGAAAQAPVAAPATGATSRAELARRAPFALAPIETEVAAILGGGGPPRAARARPFLAWLREGNLPGTLDPAVRARLLRHDRRLAAAGEPRPFHPYLYTRPAPGSYELPAEDMARLIRTAPAIPPVPGPAGGWLATALELVTGDLAEPGSRLAEDRARAYLFAAARACREPVAPPWIIRLLKGVEVHAEALAGPAGDHAAEDLMGLRASTPQLRCLAAAIEKTIAYRRGGRTTPEAAGLGRAVAFLDPLMDRDDPPPGLVRLWGYVLPWWAYLRADLHGPARALEDIALREAMVGHLHPSDASTLSLVSLALGDRAREAR